MTPLRSVAWQRLQEIFDAAVDVDPASRPAFLDERCAGDPQLRQQVESLLLHYGGDANRLDAAIDGALAASAFAPNPEAGQRLGPYRIERPLGEGGMGMVYLAVRDDEVYRKQVAIKVLRAGLGSGSMQARFRSERQILAQLDHPNIARLLDGGTTGAGVPYLVMEYVAGEPITSWCDRRSLPLRGRLELFRNVCAAVEYAHAHLVVHRDLKPSNILVTDDGTPKLLDFGIAKLLSGDNGAAFTVPVTEAGLRLMTPEYASPEQVRGDPVTTSCDVYALGVVLYELVTGRRPVTFESRTPIEIERRIADHVPPAPGTGGDLDNIILLALDKDPARRYATVDQLDADVARHLDGRPVMARPATLRYRARTFVRRHRLGVAAAAAFVLLLAAFGVAMSVVAARLARERDRAVAAERESRQIAAFLGDIFNVSNPGEQRGRTITAQEILDQGAARIRTELADQPLVQATLMDTIGKVYQNLGLYDAARAQIERSVSLRQAALGADALETLQARNDLAEIDRSQSRFDAAEKELRAVLAARERLLPADDPKIAESLNNLGLVLRERNRYKEAEPLLRRALEIRRRTLGDRHVDTTVTMTNLGQVLDSEGRLDEAETVLRQALDIRSATLGSDHPRTLNTMSTLAALLGRKGDRADAERMLREVLAGRRKVVGDRHPETAATMNTLASLLQDVGRLEEAEALYREALSIQRERSGERSNDVALTLNNLASLLESRHDGNAAEPLYRESLAIRRELFGANSASTARAQHNLGRVLIAIGRTADGEREVRQALDTRRAALGPDHPDVASSLVTLAALARDRHDLGGAEAQYRDALAIRMKRFGPQNPQTALAQVGLAEALLDRGARAEAQALLDAALPILRKTLTPGHADLARAEAALARSRAAGRP